jgi:hypothetical protein
MAHMRLRSCRRMQQLALVLLAAPIPAADMKH